MTTNVAILCAPNGARSTVAQGFPVFIRAKDVRGGQPVMVKWGRLEPSCAEGEEACRRRAFELSSQVTGYRCQQLLALAYVLATTHRASLKNALIEIGHS